MRAREFITEQRELPPEVSNLYDIPMSCLDSVQLIPIRITDLEWPWLEHAVI